VPERPLLRLPRPERIDPPRRGGGATTIIGPGRFRQRDRLGPRFDRLARAVSSPQELAVLRSDPASIAPERAIVFEVAGSLADFYAQAQRLGLEYLAEEEIELEPDDFFKRADKPEKPFIGRLYLAMPDLRALQELVRLWQRHQAGLPMERGFAPWTRLFDLLRDVRPWSPQDRVPDETVAYWDRRLPRPARAVRIRIVVP
jgi:hypothetical protein